MNRKVKVVQYGVGKMSVLQCVMYTKMEVKLLEQ